MSLCEEVRAAGRYCYVTTYHDGSAPIKTSLLFRTPEEANECARRLRGAFEPDRALTATGPGSGAGQFRVGRSVGRTIYDSRNNLVGVMDTPPLASMFVAAINATPSLAALQTDHRAAPADEMKAKRLANTDGSYMEEFLADPRNRRVFNEEVAKEEAEEPTAPPSGSPPACQCKDQKQAKCQCEPCGCKARNAASPPEYPDGSPRPPELPPRCPDCERERCSCGGSRGTR